MIVILRPWLRVLMIAIISLTIPFNTVLAASEMAACLKAHKQEKRITYSEIKRLRATIPTHLTGPQVEAGKCTLRALRLGIVFGTKKDYINVVDVENNINCLNIRLYEIDQECKCRNLGLRYAPEFEDDILLEYRKVKDLEKRLLRAGISNPVVRSYVGNLSISKDCISQSSLQLLQQTYNHLSALGL